MLHYFHKKAIGYERKINLRKLSEVKTNCIMRHFLINAFDMVQHTPLPAAQFESRKRVSFFNCAHRGGTHMPAQLSRY